MAWVRCCGGKKSLGKYIYKDGEINYDLTGGLAKTGYTQQSGWTNDVNVVFGATEISIANPSSTHCGLFGSVNAIDVTNYNTLTAKWKCNGVDYTTVVDVSNISGSYYFYFSNSAFNVNSEVLVGMSSQKTNCHTNQVAETVQGNLGYRAVTISEILFV